MFNEPPGRNGFQPEEPFFYDNLDFDNFLPKEDESWYYYDDESEDGGHENYPDAYWDG